jgi:dolichol-phosphate mannosyltransferase
MRCFIGFYYTKTEFFCQIFKICDKFKMMTRRFLKFGLVGVSGAIVFFTILLLLVELGGLGKHLSWLVAAVFSILNNFIWNNLYTWRDRRAKTKKELGRKMVVYYTFTFITTGINYLIYAFLLRRGIYYPLSAVIAILIASVLSFISYHYIVWKDKSN